MQRYLVVANQTLGRPSPSPSGSASSLGAVGSASTSWSRRRRPAITCGPKERRGRRLGRSLDAAMARFAGLGAEFEGEVGDGNPMLAIEDAMRDHGPVRRDRHLDVPEAACRSG